MLEEEEKVNNKMNESENIYPKSIKSKMIIKLRLRQILREMNKEYPLSEFGEDIDFEYKGKFNFLELKEIIDKKYTSLSLDKKLFLLKYIPLSSIGINEKMPFIKNSFTKLYFL